MTFQAQKLKIRCKIWIADEDGKVVFGAGRLRILTAVEKHGSILAAAKELGMSYRAVWGKIKATEERLGEPLLTRKAGGVQGGGSELTPLGRTLVKRFKKLETMADSATNALYQDLFKDIQDDSTS